MTLNNRLNILEMYSINNIGRYSKYIIVYYCIYIIVMNTKYSIQ